MNHRTHPRSHEFLQTAFARLGIAGIAAVCALSIVPVAAHSQGVPVLTAIIQSGQEVPPTGSTSFGNAFMTFDLTTSMLCYSISYTDLESTETIAHFHGPAQPGSSAGTLFDITPDPSPVGSPKVGCVGPLSAQERSWLISGLIYINIHSMDHPGGEIRGQVFPKTIVPEP